MHDDLVDRVAALLAQRAEPLVAAYVFGSRARGGERDDSDIDIAVLFRETPPPTLEGLPLDLVAALEDAIGLRVDLVVLNEASADLVHRVLRDGRIVADRDRAARLRFEVRKRNEYFDMLPTWRRYRRSHRGAGAP